jgi:hypothetical protein
MPRRGRISASGYASCKRTPMMIPIARAPSDYPSNAANTSLLPARSNGRYKLKTYHKSLAHATQDLGWRWKVLHSVC